MYFNGVPFGDHTTPHQRALPWEKAPKVTAPFQRRPYNPPPSLDDMMPHQTSPTVYHRGGYGNQVHEAYDRARWQGNETTTLRPDSPPPSKTSHFLLETHSPNELTDKAISQYKSTHRKELAQGNKRGEITVKTKLRAAAYTAGGTNYKKLFRFYDRDNNGTICQKEFMALARKDGKITRIMMTDQELSKVFHVVDQDHSGQIEVNELVAWITGKPIQYNDNSPASTNNGSPTKSPTRTNKEKVGVLKLFIGRKAGSNLPEKIINLVIRKGDEAGSVVHRLRNKHRLKKGQADHIFYEVKYILSNRKSGHIMMVDATVPTPKRKYQPIAVDHSDNKNNRSDYSSSSDNTRVLNSPSPEENTTMAFGRRRSIGDRGSYIAEEIAKQERRDEFHQRDEQRRREMVPQEQEQEQQHPRDSLPDGPVNIEHLITSTFDNQMAQSLEGLAQEPNSLSYTTIDGTNNENKNNGTGSAKKENDGTGTNNGINEINEINEIQGVPQTNNASAPAGQMDYPTQLRRLQIRLGKSEAENRGLRVEVKELRSLISTFQ